MRPADSRRSLSGSVGRAAIVYFALVFVAGFVLGAIRVFQLAPRLGELPAVLIESPVMLCVSWLACGWSMRRFDVRGRRAGLSMGVAAFALLMIAELALALFAFGRSPASYLSSYGAPAGAAGLVSQIAFGLIPLLRSGPSHGA